MPLDHRDFCHVYSAARGICNTAGCILADLRLFVAIKVFCFEAVEKLAQFMACKH